jgi:ubiquinone/menaquinone biosynthesis C-methylase UbiE
MAETYDDIDSHPFYAGQYVAYADDLERHAAAWHGRVLDLGCGTGIHTRLLAERADYAVGIDVSRSLVRKAREKLAGRRGTALVADATRLPFADAVFEAVQSYGEPLSHIADYEAVVRELARVTKKGGVVVLSIDNEWHARTLLHPRRLLTAIGTRGGAVRDWEYVDDQGRAQRLKLKTFTHREIRQLLERHGFRVRDAVGIHVLTLLAPVRAERPITGWRAGAFHRLHRLDRRLAARWPFSRLGYSKILSAVRRD